MLQCTTRRAPPALAASMMVPTAVALTARYCSSAKARLPIDRSDVIDDLHPFVALLTAPASVKIAGYHFNLSRSPLTCVTGRPGFVPVGVLPTRAPGRLAPRATAQGGRR